MNKSIVIHADNMKPAPKGLPSVDTLNMRHYYPVNLPGGALAPLTAPSCLAEGDWSDLRRLGPCAAGTLYTHGGELWLLDKARRQMVCLGAATFGPTQLWRHGTLLRLLNPATGCELWLDDTMPRPTVLGKVEAWPGITCRGVDGTTYTAEIASRTLSRGYAGRGEVLTPRDNTALAGDLRQAYDIIEAQARKDGRLTGSLWVQAQYIARDGTVLHTSECCLASSPDGQPYSDAITVAMDDTMTALGQYTLSAKAYKVSVSLNGDLPTAVAGALQCVRVRLSPQMHNVDWSMPCSFVPGGPGRNGAKELQIRLPLCDLGAVESAVASRLDDEALSAGEYGVVALLQGAVMPTLDVHAGVTQRLPRLSPVPTRRRAVSQQCLQDGDIIILWGGMTLGGEPCEGLLLACGADAGRVMAHVAIGGDIYAVMPMRMGRWYANQLYHYLVLGASGIYDLYCDGALRWVKTARRPGLEPPSGPEGADASWQGVWMLSQGRLLHLTTSGSRMAMEAPDYERVRCLPDGRLLLSGTEAGAMMLWPDDEMRHTRAGMPGNADADGLVGAHDGLYDVLTPDSDAVEVAWEARIPLDKSMRQLRRLDVRLRAAEAHITVDINGRRWSVDGPVKTPLTFRPFTAPAAQAHIVLTGILSADALLEGVAIS